MKQSNRRNFLKKASIGSVGLVGLTASQANRSHSKESSQNARPNVLFVISDDQTWMHAGTYGYAGIDTPGFDRVAQEGLGFNYCFTSCPASTGARSAILTGQDFWRLGPAGVTYGTLPAELDVFPILLEKSGYFTGSTGKTWGPGSLKASGWDKSPTGKIYNQKRTNPDQKGLSRIDYAANFEEFLSKRPEGKPFCFWFGAGEPHRPYQKGAGVKKGKKLINAKFSRALPFVETVQKDVLDSCTEIEYYDSHLERIINLLEKKRGIG